MKELFNNICDSEKTYLKEMDRIPLLTKEEEAELIDRAYNGDKKAREKLVKANLRFVVKYARKYKNSGLCEEDLIAAGNEGLIAAAGKIDPSKKNKFLTYAVWWIREAINKAIHEQSKDVRIPMNRKDLLKGREWNCCSLDIAVGEDGETSLGDSICDRRYDTPDVVCEKSEISRKIREGLKNLTELQARVLCERYGLDGGSEKSLREIGEMYGYSKERVRQIEAKALARMREILDNGNNGNGDDGRGPDSFTAA